MRAIKTRKNHIALKSIYALILLAGVVCLQTISAFADDSTKIAVGNISGEFIVDGNVTTYPVVVDGNTYGYIVKVPLWLRVSGSPIDGSGINNGTYISGNVSFGYGLYSQFTFTDNENHNLSYQRFENDRYDIRLGRVDGTFTNLAFDNYLWVGYSRVLLGYFVFEFDTNTNPANVYATPQTLAYTTNASTLYSTEYEYGFVNAVVSAINNASDVDTLIGIMESIDINSGYLPEILSTMRAQYPELYSLVSRIFATEGNILSVNTSTFNAVNSILNLLNNQYNTQESKVADDVEEVDGKLDALAHDIEIVKPNPNNVGDIANDAISAIDTSYNSALLTPIINTRIIGLMLVVVSLGILSYLLYGGH